MKTNWNVTFETWDEAALEAGDTDDRGFELEDVSFREAVELFLTADSELGVSTSDSEPSAARWITASGRNENTWEIKNLSIHVPNNITPSSRARLARFLGAR